MIEPKTKSQRYQYHTETDQLVVGHSRSSCKNTVAEHSAWFMIEVPELFHTEPGGSVQSKKHCEDEPRKVLLSVCK